jgi:hypothetical protein
MTGSNTNKVTQATVLECYSNMASHLSPLPGRKPPHQINPVRRFPISRLTYMVKRSAYRERDYAFGQPMLTLRTASGLTRAGLAALRRVSRSEPLLKHWSCAIHSCGAMCPQRILHQPD